MLLESSHLIVNNILYVLSGLRKVGPRLKSIIHNNERGGGDHGPAGMHPGGIDRFPGSGSK